MTLPLKKSKILLIIGITACLSNVIKSTTAMSAPYIAPSHEDEIIAQATEVNPPTDSSNNTGANDNAGAGSPNSAVPPGFISAPSDSTTTTEKPSTTPDMGQAQETNDATSNTTNPEMAPGPASQPTDNSDVMTNSSKEESPADDSLKVEDVPDTKNHQAPGGPSTPLRQALGAINKADYIQGIAMLDQILKKNPAISQAHYLKGVAYMMTHRYHDAESEYGLAIKYSTDPRLRELAQTGLLKVKSREDDN